MKNIKIFFLTIILLSILSINALAVYLEPATQNVEAGSTLNIDIKASPASQASGIELRLEITNGEILSFTDPSSIDPVLFPLPGPVGAGCTAVQTSSNICVDLASTIAEGGIVNGTLLGRMQIKVGEEGTTTITKLSGNRYTLVAGGYDTDTGTAGTYTIGGELPKTSIFDHSEDRVYALGAGLVTSGIFIYIWNKKRSRNLITTY